MKQEWVRSAHLQALPSLFWPVLCFSISAYLLLLASTSKLNSHPLALVLTCFMSPPPYQAFLPLCLSTHTFSSLYPCLQGLLTTHTLLPLPETCPLYAPGTNGRPIDLFFGSKARLRSKTSSLLGTLSLAQNKNAVWSLWLLMAISNCPRCATMKCPPQCVCQTGAAKSSGAEDS